MDTRLKILLWVIMIITAAAALWYVNLRSRHLMDTFAPSIISKAIKDVPTEVIQSPVRVYAKSAAKKLGLTIPDTSRVLSAATIPSDLHPQTVVPIIDQAGNITIESKSEPYPWLTIKDTKEIGLSYGWRDTQRMWRLDGSWTPLQIKGANLSVKASMDEDRQIYLGGRISYSW